MQKVACAILVYLASAMQNPSNPGITIYMYPDPGIDTFWDILLGIKFRDPWIAKNNPK